MQKRLNAKHSALLQRLWIKQLLLVTFLTCNSPAFAEIATIIEHSGNVHIVRSNQNTHSVSVGNSLNTGDTIVTGANGKAALLLADETMIRLHHNSEFKLNAAAPVAGWLAKTKQNLKSSYELIKGELWFRNKRRAADIKVNTQHVSISVRGTEFSVRVSDEVTLVNMLEGKVNASNAFGQLDAISGEQIEVRPDRAPIKRLLLNPEDSVQWVIQVPDIIDAERLILALSHELESSVTKKLISLINEGNYQGALAHMEQHGDNHSRSKLIQGWLQLETGLPGQAAKTLSSIALGSTPNDALALQLLATAQLLLNNIDDAHQSAKTAVNINPESSNAYVLLSYTSQAQLDLDAAQSAAVTARNLDQSSLLSWLQLARTSLGKGEFERALNYTYTAEKYIKVETSSLMTVRGFIYLAMNNTNLAKQSFAKVDIDYAGADFYLGKALLEMKSNLPESALQSISTAVALQPLEASYLNYYGRMLYELKRMARAEEVLKRAIELDPNDPTAYYLLAIIKRDRFKEGEAIALLQSAEKLNDNRAVYRSRFILDEDKAIKNVDLSLSYLTFGFNAWTENKAIEALSLDSTNYSAHLLYASATNQQPGRDLAFASAALKARIYQPANANTFSTFNNHTALFETPVLGGALGIERGSFNSERYDIEVYGSIPEKNLAFQAGSFDYQSDGWRKTFDENSESQALIAKWDNGARGNLLLSFNSRNARFSDNLDQRYESDGDSDPNLTTIFDVDRYELAYNFKPEGYAKSLVSYISLLRQAIDSSTFTSNNITYNSLFVPGGSALIPFSQTKLTEIQQDALISQVHYSEKTEKAQFQAGYFYYNEDSQQLTDNTAAVQIPAVVMADPFSGSLLAPTLNTVASLNLLFDGNVDREQRSIYFTSEIKPSLEWNLEFSIYRDRLENSDIQSQESWILDHWNPRFGVTYNFQPNQSLRLAAFRYLYMQVPGRIDPIEIAGANIYRGSRNGALTKTYSASYDFEWPNGFVQVIASNNESKTEFRSNVQQDLGGGNFIYEAEAAFEEQQWDEINLHVNWLPIKTLGTTFNYNYLDLKNKLETSTVSSVSRVENNSIVGINWVHSSGLRLRIENSYRRINYKFRSGDDEFSSTNAILRYALPNRRGQIIFEANNVFDEKFNWVVDSFAIDNVAPRRNFVGRIEIYHR